MSRNQVIQQIRFENPSCGFRSKFLYNIITYSAAGQCLARTAGTSWEDFVTQHLLKPLNMVSTLASTDDLKTAHDVATPHVVVDGSQCPYPVKDITNIAPAGAIYSNVMDMSNWMIMLLNGGKYNGKQIIVTSLSFTYSVGEVGPFSRVSDSK